MTEGSSHTQTGGSNTLYLTLQTSYQEHTFFSYLLFLATLR